MLKDEFQNVIHTLYFFDIHNCEWLMEWCVKCDFFLRPLFYVLLLSVWFAVGYSINNFLYFSHSFIWFIGQPQCSGGINVKWFYISPVTAFFHALSGLPFMFLYDTWLPLIFKNWVICYKVPNSNSHHCRPVDWLKTLGGGRVGNDFFFSSSQSGAFDYLWSVGWELLRPLSVSFHGLTALMLGSQEGTKVEEDATIACFHFLLASM